MNIETKIILIKYDKLLNCFKLPNYQAMQNCGNVIINNLSTLSEIFNTKLAYALLFMRLTKLLFKTTSVITYLL